MFCVCVLTFTHLTCEGLEVVGVGEVSGDGGVDSGDACREQLLLLLLLLPQRTKSKL